MNNILGLVVLVFLVLACGFLFLWCLKLCIDMHLKFFEEKVKMHFNNAYSLSFVLTCFEFAAGFYIASRFIKVSI